MDHQKTNIFMGIDHMKRSPSELALDALVNNKSTAMIKDHHHHHPLFSSFHHDDHHHNDAFLDPTANVVAHDHLAFDFKNQDIIINNFPTSGGFDQQSLLWYQNITQQQPCASATLDSQSSICAGSPTSILTKPKTGDNQGSGSSEDDDEETEAGQCEQSDDPVDVKRMRRMFSNRESARRSRRRKQEHLKELEVQVEALGTENSTLFKQLNDAAQQLREATTNNRVLKSDVEALRAKVKLAEDMVTRGTVNQLLQTNTLGSPSPHMVASTQNLSRVSNVTPTIMVQGQDASFDGVFSWQNSSIGSNNSNMDHVLHGNNARSGGLVSDTISCVSEMWR